MPPALDVIVMGALERDPDRRLRKGCGDSTYRALHLVGIEAVHDDGGEAVLELEMAADEDFEDASTVRLAGGGDEAVIEQVGSGPLFSETRCFPFHLLG